MQSRLGGLGSTDIAEICGLSPYKGAGPWRVYNLKAGVVAEDLEAGTDEQDWGLEVEPFLAAWYGRQVGRGIVHAPRGSMRVFRPGEEWLWASPDAKDGDDYLEIKNVGSFMAHRWDRADDDGIPDDVRAQVTIGMWCTGRPTWTVVAAIGGLPPRIYRVDYDAELADMLVAKAAEFWSHVRAAQPPPVDGSLSCLDYLRRKYPRDERPMIESTSWAEDIAVTRIMAASERKKFEALVKQCDAKLREACGDARGILGDGWKFTWKLGAHGERRARFTVKGQDDE